MNVMEVLIEALLGVPNGGAHADVMVQTEVLMEVRSGMLLEACMDVLVEVMEVFMEVPYNYA